MTDVNANETPELPAPPGFETFSLSAATLDSLHEAGFHVPLPVQRACFEPLRAGRDALVQAATGTGKTLAYGLPLIEGLSPTSQGPSFLVLAPTRELAAQVAGELGRIGGKGGLKIALLYGGISVEPQMETLRRGVHGIVGTPGRVLDIFDRMPKMLKTLRILVLDEADQLLSMGFEPDIEAIVQRFPGRYQGAFVSATLPPDILRLAERFLRDPALIALAEDGITPSEIRHEMFLIDPANRLRDLVRILEAERPENSFIFCNTRDDAQILSGNLRERGFAVDLLSGELHQHERDRVMAAVRDGKVQHLVATDLAARGLDVMHLTHVIHYQFPQSSELYVHRSGRVGRVGQTGTAISLVGPQDVATLYMLRLTYGIRPLERRLPSDAEIAREREVDLVRGLLERYGGSDHDPDAVALLRRLTTHVDGEKVLAAILRAHVGEAGIAPLRRRTVRPPAPAAKPAAPPPRPAAPAPRPAPAPQPAATPAAKPPTGARNGAATAQRPAPAKAEPAEAGAAAGVAKAVEEQTHRRSRGRRGGPGEAAATTGPGPRDAGVPGGTGVEDDAPPPSRESEERPRPEDFLPSRSSTGKDMRNLFLTVGSSDGVDGDFLGQWLQGRLALRSSDFGPVQVRDRSTVVCVPVERVNDAIGALSGLRFGGREVHVEEAKRR